MRRRSKRKAETQKVPAARLSTPVSRAGLNDRWLAAGVCIFLAAIIWAVFGQTLHHEFVNYDDDRYIYENPVVQKGLTWAGIQWAFEHVHCSNWHPLTWMSHMLDCQLYGLNPGGHHLTNVLLHTAATILLFLVLRRMTGALWHSAFVAAVFAIHPLRVESVAWVAERKDVLSGVFFMLAIGAYVRHVQKAEVGRQRSDVGSRRSDIQLPSSGYYWLSLFFFALGLMCKPMLVTLPLVLLLLDYWPLERFSIYDLRFTIFKKLLIEKIPFFVLSAASCVVTIFAQQDALQSFENVPLPIRAGNAAISSVAYLNQMFWPTDLTVLYPFTSASVRASGVVLSLVLLAGISAGAFALRRRCPYFLTGWLWYLIMLAPVIGIIQVGSQARADRYTYLPQIGLYVLLTWAAADLCAGRRLRRVVLGGCSAVILAALISCAHTQVACWQDSESLWTHTLACTSGNSFAYNNLGNALLDKGNVDGAIADFQKALQIKPDFEEAFYSMGSALLRKGSVDEAIAYYKKALQIRPGFAEAYNSLGNALLQKGRVDEAIVDCQKALQIKPDFAEAFYSLGSALLQKGRVDEAIAYYQKALQIKPDFAEAHNNLGNALLQKGRVDEAITHFQQALRIKPNYTEACYNLGSALLQKGRVDEAIAYYQKALQIKPDSAEACNNLGSALFQKGRVDEAIGYYQRALQIKPDYAQALFNLGIALLQKGGVNEAITCFQRALQINPNYAEACYSLGSALLQKGRVGEAIPHLRQALQIKPDYVEAQNNLAWVLATCPQASLRNGNQALELAQRANLLTGGGNPVVLGTLAAAYAESGRFTEAEEAAQRALQLAETQSNTALADAIRSQMKLYQAGIPFHSQQR